MELQPKQVWKT